MTKRKLTKRNPRKNSSSAYNLLTGDLGRRVKIIYKYGYFEGVLDHKYDSKNKLKFIVDVIQHTFNNYSIISFEENDIKSIDETGGDVIIYLK